jgi:hypothetical protein
VVPSFDEPSHTSREELPPAALLPPPPPPSSSMCSQVLVVVVTVLRRACTVALLSLTYCIFVYAVSCSAVCNVLYAWCA